MSKLDNNNLKEERNIFKLIMTLHIDKMNLHARHLFRNQSVFGPSRNDPNYLANSMLGFLMTTLTEEKRSGKKCAVKLFLI